MIDDDELIRALLLEMRVDLGHTTVGAANGFEGVKLFGAAPAALSTAWITRAALGRT